MKCSNLPFITRLSMNTLSYREVLHQIEIHRDGLADDVSPLSSHSDCTCILLQVHKIVIFVATKGN